MVVLMLSIGYYYKEQEDSPVEWFGSKTILAAISVMVVTRTWQENVAIFHIFYISKSNLLDFTL